MTVTSHNGTLEQNGSGLSERKLLADFLRENLPASDVEVTTIEQIAGGSSRLMYKVDTIVDGVQTSFVSRGDPPPGIAVIDTSRDQEWAVLDALTRMDDKPIAAARCYDRHGVVSGRKTIYSDYVESRTLRAVLDAADASDHPTLARSLASAAGAIHQTDVAALGGALECPPSWQSSWDAYLDDRIEQWRKVERDHVESDPFIRYLAAWLDTHRPPPAPLGLVHGDFHNGNVIVSTDGEFVAVDWEFARVGDPREDLGWYTAMSLSIPPDLINGELEVFCEAYREQTRLGEDVINASTIRYFQMLSGASLYGGVLEQASRIARGEISTIRPIYVTGYLAAAHDTWLHGPRDLEAEGEQ